MLVLSGNLIYTLAVKLFLLPADPMSCGTTGLAMLVNRLTGIPLTVFIFLFNMAILAVGWCVMGRKFALNTIFSSLFYPIALELLDRTMGTVQITDNLLLNILFAGLGMGLGLGIVIRGGASTGGMDIPPLLLNKYFRAPISAAMYTFDFCILLLQALFRPFANILYGILLVIIYTVVLDKMLLLGNSRLELKIISEKYREISDTVLSRIDRGVTLLKSESGYLHNESQLVLSIISKRELIKVERLVRAIDPESFMVVSRVSEVSGRGFSLKKLYHPPMQRPQE